MGLRTSAFFGGGDTVQLTTNMRVWAGWRNKGKTVGWVSLGWHLGDDGTGAFSSVYGIWVRSRRLGFKVVEGKQGTMMWLESQRLACVEHVRVARRPA